MEYAPTWSGHDDYGDPSYYFTTDIDYDETKYDWSQERWIIQCLNREQSGMDHYGFFDTPLWIQQGINLMSKFHRIQMDRVSDMRKASMEAKRGSTGAGSQTGYRQY